MNSLLARLLKKRGIEKIEDLKGDEKQTFDKWQGILSSGEMTVESVASFCRRQIEAIEKSWEANAPSRDRLIDQHIVYRKILQSLSAPQTERENLEKYLESLLT